MNARPGATDTIAARATAAGAAAVAIVRVSGPLSLVCAERIAGPAIEPRRALLRSLRDTSSALIDRGVVLYFPGPGSFTGEDVVEFQCHGAVAVVDWLLETLYELGVRPAEPGEFSLRAFLNDRLDLTQAEAVADLIGSSSRAAAQAALRSLTGEFAMRVRAVQLALTELRVLCEAWLDFPDEDIDAGTTTSLAATGRDIGAALDRLAAEAGAGVALTDGLAVALAGEPNAGKSSLLNRLLAADAAIVSETPGTTRDVLEHTALVAGMPIRLTDTAGLRESGDAIERAGIERARGAVARADLVLWVADIRQDDPDAAARRELPAEARYLLVLNKTDLVEQPAIEAIVGTVSGAPETLQRDGVARSAGVVPISALHGDGMPELLAAIARFAGLDAGAGGTFSARGRHLAALTDARAHVDEAARLFDGSLDLAAEELRRAQNALGAVTGEVSSDDLLGQIFSTFCIGK